MAQRVLGIRDGLHARTEVGAAATTNVPWRGSRSAVTDSHNRDPSPTSPRSRTSSIALRVCWLRRARSSTVSR